MPIMRVDKPEKVLERLGTTESTTLTLKREDGGKIRVTSLLWESPELLWESPEVILRDELLEVRNMNGVLHIARKVRYHDECFDVRF